MIRSMTLISLTVLFASVTTGCANWREATEPTAEAYIAAFSEKNVEQANTLLDKGLIGAETHAELFAYFERNCGSFPFEHESTGWQTSSAAGCGEMGATTTGTFTYTTSTETACTVAVTVRKTADKLAVVGVNIKSTL